MSSPTTPSPTTPSPAHLDYLKTINQTLYGQIKTADQKAAYIFTFLIALLVWSTEVRKVFLWMDSTAWFTPVWFLSVLLVTSLTFAIVCAALVLVPRNRKGGVSLYWRAWPEAGQRLTDALATADQTIITSEYVANASDVSAICERKYLYVRLAFRGLVGAVLCHIALLLMR